MAKRDGNRFSPIFFSKKVKNENDLAVLQSPYLLARGLDINASTSIQFTPKTPIIGLRVSKYWRKGEPNVGGRGFLNWRVGFIYWWEGIFKLAVGVLFIGGRVFDFWRKGFLIWRRRVL